MLRYEKIQRKYRLTEEEIQETLNDLWSKAVRTPGEFIPHVITEDPPDNFFLGCALEAQADYIVSGDRHLRKLKAYRGIQIVTPSAFVEILER